MWKAATPDRGQADLGICTLNDMRANAEMLANLSPRTPLIADAETGVGCRIDELLAGEMSAPLGLYLVLDVEGRYAGPGNLHAE
jgi:hypothetical protein